MKTPTGVLAYPVYAASFVCGCYVNNIDSILKLGWLPMKERREWHILKAVHKAIYS